MVAVAGRGWKLAPSLEAAWREANRIAPGRSRISDGSIGDAAHSARTSDHNPDRGWVDALDLTHDPAGGFDAHGHARQIAARRDPRVHYIISNRRIWNSRRASEGWRNYTGSNPHNRHIHISILDSGRGDTSPWFGAVVPFPQPPAPPIEDDQEDDDMGSYMQESTGRARSSTSTASGTVASRAPSSRRRRNLARLSGRPIVLEQIHPWGLAKFLMDFDLCKDPPAQR